MAARQDEPETAKVRAPNVAQLRHAIDSGETGDKVPFPDIATSPLGTDAEAGGHPATTAEVALSLAQQSKRRSTDLDGNASAKKDLPGVSVGSTLLRPGPQHAPWFIAAGMVLLVLATWLALAALGLLP